MDKNANQTGTETQLLIIKCGPDYIRVRETGYEKTGLNKASVFPMSALDRVRRHVRDMTDHHRMAGSICQLWLREEPFEDHEGDQKE